MDKTHDSRLRIDIRGHPKVIVSSTKESKNDSNDSSSRDLFYSSKPMHNKYRMCDYSFSVFVIHFLSLNIIKIKDTRVNIRSVNMIPKEEAEPTWFI